MVIGNIDLKERVAQEVKSRAAGISPCEDPLIHSSALTHRLFKMMVEKKACNLHIRVSCPPVFRVDGELETEEDLSPLTAEEIEGMFLSISTPAQRDIFTQELELNFIYSVPDLARFRINAQVQRGTIALTIRLVPYQILSIDDLGLPPILKKLILKPRGLILITGPTGCGKSTTVAAMINHLNQNVKRNIVTIEDPIEFLHNNKKCIISQREVGSDTRSLSIALKNGLRQDPDVIVVGEMQDLETMSAAITAAETGHLVISTLHTLDASQTIDRIVDVFPPTQQEQIRFQLSQVLEAALSQVLLRRIGGGGRVAACEVMIANSAVRNLIREGKTFQLPSVIQLGSKDGMQTLNGTLADLVKKRVVTLEEACMKTGNEDGLLKLVPV